MKVAGTNLSRSARQGLLMTGASALTLLAATAAQAQDTAPASQPAAEAEQEVVITGRRMASPGLTSPCASWCPTRSSTLPRATPMSRSVARTGHGRGWSRIS